ncbi:MAG: phosphate ABC transporter permease PstA [Microthrixaceae bacterium]|nr:phosphate ABC transporter permease PstA [Microthrixaceae bacterium]MCB1013236.1 phosphate ABC transporter permease PstA [Microthrixaceae bacterium]MCB9387708.1 phosphate ABC transporter permease PstA [Microthrixaceae bacterium]MCO5322669.1 phosphate ABC transporter permease PstA [Microthrixaceae bacterium]
MSVMSNPATVGSTAATERVRRSITGGKADVKGTIFMLLMLMALLMSVVILAVLVIDMVTQGRTVLTERLGDFVTGSMSSQPEASGILQGLRGTFWIGVFTVVIAFPLGIASAIYLEEYAHHKSRVARFIDVNIRNLAGVPSVVYGILGLTLFVKAMGGIVGPNSNGRSVIAAGLTLAILVLPIVIITSAEALRAVPRGIREAGFGVGATRWEVTRHHVLPYAAPGILTGTVLALARSLGEAAPLILVGATTGYLSGGTEFLDLGALTDRFTALPIIITTWAGRPGEGWVSVTAAAIIVLLVVVLVANAAAILLRNRFDKKRG